MLVAADETSEEKKEKEAVEQLQEQRRASVLSSVGVGVYAMLVVY